MLCATTTNTYTHAYTGHHHRANAIKWKVVCEKMQRIDRIRENEEHRIRNEYMFYIFFSYVLFRSFCFFTLWMLLFHIEATWCKYIHVHMFAQQTELKQKKKNYVFYILRVASFFHNKMCCSRPHATNEINARLKDWERHINREKKRVSHREQSAHTK